MRARPSPTDWFLFGLISVFWGTSYLFIKIGLETLAPFTLIAGRLFFGAIVLGIALWLSKAALPRDRGTYGNLVVMAIVNIVVPFSLITWGEKSIDSSLAAILQATTPLFTLIVAALAIDEEANTLNRLVGLIIGFGGVVILFSGGLGEGGNAHLMGMIAIVLSSISYACGAVFVRLRMKGQPPTVPAFFQVGIAFLIVSVLAILFDSPIALPRDGRSLFAVVWLGVFGSSLAYLIFFRLVHTLGPTRISLIAYVMPIVAIVAGMLVLDEVLELQMMIGTAVILAGVGLANSRLGARRIFGRQRKGVPPIAQRG